MPITPRPVPAFAVGDKVLVDKYGAFYPGTIVRVGRKLVDVRFRTKAGKDKVTTVDPYYDVKVAR